MALSAIHLINWFYSFSLNRLSLIWFCNWKKKKKKLVWKIQVNPTRPATRLTRPEPDPTRPFCHVYQRVTAGWWRYQILLKVGSSDFEVQLACQIAHSEHLWAHQSSQGWSGLHLKVQLVRMKLYSSCHSLLSLRVVLQPLSQSPLVHLLFSHLPLHHLGDEFLSL